MMETQPEFNLALALDAADERITDEQRAENEQFQNEMHTRLASRIDPNSKEGRIALAKSQEKDILAQIKFLQEQPDTLIRQNRMTQAFNRLGELLAMQGNYEMAKTVSIDGAKREHYAAIHDAIERDDDEICSCQGERITNPKTGDNFIQSKTMVLDEVYSEKHNSIRPLTLCRECGLMQVK